MCVDPGTLALISLGVTAASGIASSVGGYYDARAQNSTLEYNRQAQLQNAAQARQEASYARAQAQRNANEKRKETAVLIGAQRAKMGASGALVDSGSFLDISLSTREEGEKDAVGMLQQGDMEAWRHDVRAQQFEEQGRIYGASKKNPGSVLAGSLLSGLAQTGMSYFTMKDYMGGTTGSGSSLFGGGSGNVFTMESLQGSFGQMTPLSSMSSIAKG